MIDDHDIARLDEIYVRKDDCQDIQSTVGKKLAKRFYAVCRSGISAKA